MKTAINKASTLKQIFYLFLIALIFSNFNICYAQELTGVLVTHESSSISKLSILELRRIYLGLPASSDSLIKRPVINTSNKQSYKAFLKNIMHMTEKGYQRKIVKRIFRQGGKKITEIDNIEEILSHLKNNPYDITFMTEETVKKSSDIRVIQKLW